MLSTVSEKCDGDEPAFTSTLPIVTSTTLLNSVHLQFLAGCFGLGNMGTDGAANAQLYHYQVRLALTRDSIHSSTQILLGVVHMCGQAVVAWGHQDLNPGPRI